ncbi:MAG: aldo/keto reductase [Rhodocyclaceae bacterium]
MVNTQVFWRMTRAQFLRLGMGAATLAMVGREAGAQAAPRILTRPIPSSGEPLPIIGCGTWRTFSTDPTQRDELVEVLRILFAAGGSVIDSSPMYGTAEAAVGQVLAQLGTEREHAFLATKVWTQGRREGIAQMEQSLKHFRRERIALMQIHNLVDWRTQLATLRAWKAEGRIRYIGVTHYTASAFAELEAVMRAEPLDFVQINYAANDRQAESRILPLAAERGMAVIVNQPFGGGGLIRRMQSAALPAWAAEIGCSSWAQVLLKFVLAHPAVTVAIPGTGQARHMTDNIQAGMGAMPTAVQRQLIINAI